MWENRTIRVLVTKEAVTPESANRNESEKPDMVFVAIALEHYVVAQSDDLDELRDEIEQLLIVQEHLDCFPVIENQKKSGPAPEDYQRMRNFGDNIIHSDKFWREKIGSPPIVARWDIDISKSDWKVVDDDENEDDYDD